MSKLKDTSNQNFTEAEAPPGGVGSSKGAPRGRRAAKLPKFYIVDAQKRSRASGLKMVNQDEVFSFGTGLLSSVQGEEGFHDGQVTPIFLANAKSGRIDRDLEVYGGTGWSPSE